MAGVIPGVESARRRRFHQSSSASGSAHGGSGAGSYSFFWRHSRKTMGSSSTSVQPWPNYASSNCYDDSMLDETAREAKKRLDERLQPYASRKSPQQSVLFNRTQSSNPKHEARPKPRKVGTDGKSDGGGRKLRWRWSEQEECAVCLEPLQLDDEAKSNDNDKAKGSMSMNNSTMLPCAHKFHTTCLTPWLRHGHSSCPCCRIQFTSSTSSRI